MEPAGLAAKYRRPVISGPSVSRGGAMLTGRRLCTRADLARAARVCLGVTLARGPVTLAESELSYSLTCFYIYTVH